ncbi:MAG TPA: carotenoid biosynthesis protein [Acidobacteriaceae bacterium]
MILAEAVSPWFNLPMLGNIGFVLFFVLFSVFHCCAVEGPKRTAIFFAVSAIVTYAMEETGVRTGLVFGAYHYSDMLGIKLGHVPVLIPLGWFMMIYPSRVVAKAILRTVDVRSIPGITVLAALSATVMTAWDLVMDPAMSTLAGNWVWEKGGIYFGVPRRNYLGWLLTTFLVYWLVGLLWRADDGKNTATRTFAALPVIVYAFFTVRYVATNSFPQLQVVALFSMGLPAFVSLIQICMNRSVTAQHAGVTADIAATVAEDTISV